MKIGAIVVTWNGLEYTKHTIKSMRSKHPMEIIISDNGSTDGTQEWAEGEGLTLIDNIKNYSRATAWNSGIKYFMDKGCDTFLMVNNDLIHHKDCIDVLVDAFYSKPNIGLLTSITQYAYLMSFGKIPPADLPAERGGRREAEIPTDDTITMVDALPMSREDPIYPYPVMGPEFGHICYPGVFAISRDVFNKVGLWDANLQIGDYCVQDFMHRMYKVGLDNYCYFPAFTLHYGSRSEWANKVNIPMSWIKWESLDYYYLKWGDSRFGHEKFEEPFDGEKVEWTLKPVEVGGVGAMIPEKDDPYVNMYAPTRDTFIREIFEEVPGMTLENAGQWLFDKAFMCDRENAIVEIGSAEGRSTLALAHGANMGNGAMVYAVDPFNGCAATPGVSIDSFGEGEPNYINQGASYDVFIKNIEKFGMQDLITPLMDYSEMVIERNLYPGDPIGVLFIDGHHTYKMCKMDFDLWAPMVVKGGIIGFHDSAMPGVKKVIDEIGVDSGYSDVLYETITCVVKL